MGQHGWNGHNRNAVSIAKHSLSPSYPSRLYREGGMNTPMSTMQQHQGIRPFQHGLSCTPATLTANSRREPFIVFSHDAGPDKYSKLQCVDIVNFSVKISYKSYPSESAAHLRPLASGILQPKHQQTGCSQLDLPPQLCFLTVNWGQMPIQDPVSPAVITQTIP